jgi:hypothetical protein
LGISNPDSQQADIKFVNHPQTNNYRELLTSITKAPFVAQ